MLIGERVVLRARRRSDLARLQPVVRDDVETVALMDDEPWLPRSLESAQARFDKQLSDEPPSDGVSLVVQCRDDPEEQAVGTAGLWGLDLHARLAHVALVMAREARGSGLGTDALRVLCDYAFRIRGLHRLQVDTLAANEAMARAAAAAGFTREGVLRDAAWLDGRHADMMVMGLLAPHWWGSPAEQRQVQARATRPPEQGGGAIPPARR